MNATKQKPAPVVAESTKHQNGDIALAFDGAGPLAQADLPFEAAMRLYDAIELLEPKARAVRKEEEKLYRKHGTTTGNTVQIPAENVKAFNDEHMALLTMEQEIAGLPSISVADLGDLSALKIKTMHLGALRRIGLLVFDTAA